VKFGSALDFLDKNDYENDQETRAKEVLSNLYFHGLKSQVVANMIIWKFLEESNIASEGKFQKKGFYYSVMLEKV
jgi:hypothetical protein